MAARETILARLRAATALGDTTQAWKTLPRGYDQAGPRPLGERVALLVERLEGYDAEVTQTTAQDLPATLAKVLEKSGRKRLVAPPGMPAAWLTQGTQWLSDTSLSHEAIDAADGVMTAASCAIADSGTIALHHGPQEGRRVLTLLPDWHLIVLLTSQIVGTLPEYFTRIAEPPGLITWISGPSATADIEMTRIKGVHGPRFLSVVIAQDDAATVP